MESSKVKSIVLPVAFTVCFIWAFFAGFLIHKYAVTPPKNVPVLPRTSQNPTAQEEYDVVLVTNEDSPRLVLLDFVKDATKFYGKARYFDGAIWHAQDLKENNININGNLLKFRNVDKYNYLDNTRININLSIGDVIVQLEGFNLPTPIAIKTRKTFTKFAGAKNSTESKLQINNQPIDAKIAVLKGYNLEKDATSEMDLGVTTYWFVFWDAQGNFYHLDKSVVLKPTSTYQSHDFFGILYKEANPHADYYSDSLSVSLNEDLLKISFKDAISTSYYEYTLSNFFERKGFDLPSRGAVLKDGSGGIGLYLDLGI